MYVLTKASHHEDSVVAYDPPGNLAARLSRIARREFLSYGLRRYQSSAPDGLANFCDDRSMYGSDPWRRIPEYDLIHLHWLLAFLDYTTFFAALPPGTPLVWTLHDMAPFTGGCHWNQGCRRFAEECGACPQLGSGEESDWTRGVWRRKRKSLEKIASQQLHIVTPSQWLQEERKRSALFSRFSGSVIPYGIDTDVFAPRDRRTAREVFGLPLECKIVLFLADALNIPRKGFSTLAEALPGMAPNVLLLSVGRGRPPAPNTVAHVHFDEIQNDRILSYAYSAADVLAVPSLQDNLPNTILESLACGTPVVASDVGGIADAVRPGLTGYLARAGDVAGLRAIICRMLERDDERIEMSKTCRSIALGEYSMQLQAQRYMALYQELYRGMPG